MTGELEHYSGWKVDEYGKRYRSQLPTHPDYREEPHCTELRIDETGLEYRYKLPSHPESFTSDGSAIRKWQQLTVEALNDPAKWPGLERGWVKFVLNAPTHAMFKLRMKMASMMKPIDQWTPEGQQQLADKAATIDPIGGVDHHRMSDEQIAQAAARLREKRSR